MRRRRGRAFHRARRSPKSLAGGALLLMGLVCGAWLFPATGAAWTVSPAAEGRLATEPMLDLRGETRTLDDWSGRIRLVNFWATWCAPCREEMPLFQDAYQRYRDRNFVVIGVALDSVDAVLRFKARLGITYPLLVVSMSTALDLMKQHGNRAGAVPFSLLLSPDGDVLDSHLGAFDEVSLRRLLDGHLVPPAPSTRLTGVSLPRRPR